MSKSRKAPELRCVTDEVLDHHGFSYRVVIWRGNGLRPVVAFEATRENAAPDMFASFLAMRVLRNYLGYSTPLPLWFHRSIVQGHLRSFRVTFTENGHKLRPWLNNPTYVAVEHGLIDGLLEP